MAYKKLDIGEPKNIAQLSQYIAQEFDRVAQYLRASQGAATLIQETAGVEILVNPTAVLLQEWTATTPPSEFFAVVASIPDAGIHIRRPGMYTVSFVVQGEVEVNREYEIAVFNSGVGTILKALADPSNQTDVVTLVATGSQRLRSLTPGAPGIDDLLQLFISSPQTDSTWTTLNAFMTVVWVAE